MPKLGKTHHIIYFRILSHSEVAHLFKTDDDFPKGYIEMFANRLSRHVNKIDAREFLKKTYGY